MHRRLHDTGKYTLIDLIKKGELRSMEAVIGTKNKKQHNWMMFGR